jgi:hypothetical protein
MANQHFPRPPVKGPVVIPNCAEVKLLWLQNGMQLANVLHGNLTAAGPLNPAVAESIFSAIKANAATLTWFGHLETGISLTHVHVKDLRAPNNPTIESTGLPLAGTSAGRFSAQDLALVVTLRTQFSGKGFFGRVYLPGITEDNLADTRHFAGAVSSPAIAFLNGVNSAMTAQGLPWVVAHRALQANTDPAAPPSQQQPRPAGVTPITAAVLTDLRIDSQRRRLGRN